MGYTKREHMNAGFFCCPYIPLNDEERKAKFSWMPKNWFQVLFWIPMAGFYLMNIASNIMLNFYSSLDKEIVKTENKAENQ